ncbi:MAG TPA: malto-oligosyltrehalose synthase, partial [Steroidobacteraceae bacterium]|nr:malto-oligosyltrehalose synthase [Steroidobacteraceae bacterium]
MSAELTSDSRSVQRRVPRATYRLQLNHQFTFEDARKIVPYLARLGISHVYASPILRARPGSMHGYDVVEHGMLNPELGTREQFDALVAELHAHGLGLIVDIVPNHLGIMGQENSWWLDVLENGPAAHFASYFDIDWRPNRASLRDRVLVPILGGFYGAVLEAGELQLKFDAGRGSFNLHYYDHCFPIDPREYARIFEGRSAALDALLRADDPDHGDFESLLTAFSHLPPRNRTDEESVTVRYRDKEAHKRRLARLVERSPKVGKFIEDTVAWINGTPGQPDSFNALDSLIEAQAYRLSYWRVAVDEINYRRFFDVNDLAALRMNEREVFDVTHRFIFELIDQGAIDGLRIDHSDGLYDPEVYFERLQQRFGADEQNPRPLYVVTEKILAAYERLPESWKVHGTTGYEFAAVSTCWMVCADNEAAMTRRYRQFTENDASFDEIVCVSKKLVMRAALAAEVEVLATQLDRIAQLDRHTADFTRAAMREAIIETIAAFPVYRTYVSHRGVSDEDRRIVNWAINIARKRSAIEVSVFDFLRDVVLGDAAANRPESHRQAMMEFAMKFQQVTSPVTAKGVEDTAFYRYSRLVCLNEVGGDPRRFSVSNTALHQANVERAKQWPFSMLATSTHDTKRSEDVRARIAVLSEMPERWKLHLSRWSKLNRSRRKIVDSRAAPDREDEYLIYQTLVGMWTADQSSEELIERLKAYVVKAARESKRITSWLAPNPEYETALQDFVQRLLENPELNAFLRDFSSLANDVIYFGALNSLVQVALKLTVPGVPDIYQGTERPALALVDPDNRRPVDYAAAQAELNAIESAPAIPNPMSATAKLFVTWKLLQLRAQKAAVFAQSDYQIIQVEGHRKDHVLAFAREHAGEKMVAVLPRWFAKLMNATPGLPLGAEVWGDTRLILPNAIQGTDVFTGRT